MTSCLLAAAGAGHGDTRVRLTLQEDRALVVTSICRINGLMLGRTPYMLEPVALEPQQREH